MKNDYINSGLEWLGNIPSNWKIKKLKSVLNERNVMNKNGDEKFILSLTINDGVIPYSEKKSGGNKAKDDITKYKIAKKNDIIINSMNVVVGAAGISKYDGVISPVYYSFYEKNDISDYRYYYYLFLTKTYQDHLFGMGNGIMVKISDESGKMNTIRKKIPVIKIKNDMIPYPPLDVQKRIADFLDNKLSLINNIIKNNLKSIETLSVLKKCRINEVVKEGIRKNRNYKSTNSNYYKRIPEDWNISKVKYIAKSILKGNGITKEEIFENGDIQCVRYGEIYSKYDNSFISTYSKTFLSKINSPREIFKGDILFAGTGELIEEIGKNVVYMGDKPCIAGGDIIILRHKYNPIFLNYSLNSITSQEQKSKGKLKLKVVHIYPSEIGNIEIAMPSIDEQNEIANYLDNYCSKIDQIIEYRKRIIEKLEEYKKSLIYEVVTGKKEV